VGIDRAAADAIEALELPRCAQVVSLDVKIECTERQDKSNKDWGRPRNDDKGKPGYVGQSVKCDTKVDECGMAAYLWRN
jgi:hypothetical protein